MFTKSMANNRSPKQLNPQASNDKSGHVRLLMGTKKSGLQKSKTNKESSGAEKP